jgi:superfamily II DNA or RNA helicase
MNYDIIKNFHDSKDRKNSVILNSKFDLVIIDEAHKFRNDYTDMYVSLQEICKRPRSKPSENGIARN